MNVAQTGSSASVRVARGAKRTPTAPLHSQNTSCYRALSRDAVEISSVRALTRDVAFRRSGTTAGL